MRIASNSQAQPVKDPYQFSNPYGVDPNVANDASKPRPSAFSGQYQNTDGTWGSQPNYAQRDAFVQNINNATAQYQGGQKTGQPQFDFNGMMGQANQMVKDGWQNPFAQQPAQQPQQSQQPYGAYAPQPQQGPQMPGVYNPMYSQAPQAQPQQTPQQPQPTTMYSQAPQQTQAGSNGLVNRTQRQEQAAAKRKQDHEVWLAERGNGWDKMTPDRASAEMARLDQERKNMANWNPSAAKNGEFDAKTKEINATIDRLRGIATPESNAAYAAQDQRWAYHPGIPEKLEAAGKERYRLMELENDRARETALAGLVGKAPAGIGEPYPVPADKGVDFSRRSTGSPIDYMPGGMPRVYRPELDDFPPGQDPRVNRVNGGSPLTGLGGETGVRPIIDFAPGTDPAYQKAANDYLAKNGTLAGFSGTQTGGAGPTPPVKGGGTIPHHGTWTRPGGMMQQDFRDENNDNVDDRYLNPQGRPNFGGDTGGPMGGDVPPRAGWEPWIGSQPVIKAPGSPGDTTTPGVAPDRGAAGLNGYRESLMKEVEKAKSKGPEDVARAQAYLAAFEKLPPGATKADWAKAMNAVTTSISNGSYAKQPAHSKFGSGGMQSQPGSKPASYLSGAELPAHLKGDPAKMVGWQKKEYNQIMANKKKQTKGQQSALASILGYTPSEEMVKSGMYGGILKSKTGVQQQKVFGLNPG